MHPALTQQLAADRAARLMEQAARRRFVAASARQRSMWFDRALRRATRDPVPAASPPRAA